MKTLILLFTLILILMASNGYADGDSIITIGKEKHISDQISIICINGNLWKAKQMESGISRTYKLSNDDGSSIECGDKLKEDIIKKKTDPLTASFDKMMDNLAKSQTPEIIPRINIMCINGKLWVNTQAKVGPVDNYMVEYNSSSVICGDMLKI